LNPNAAGRSVTRATAKATVVRPPTLLVLVCLLLATPSGGVARAGAGGPRAFWAKFAEGHRLGSLGAGKHTPVHAWVVAQQLLGHARLLRRHQRLPFPASSREARQTTEVLATLGLDHDLHALPSSLAAAIGLGPKAGALLLDISRSPPAAVHTIEVGQLKPHQWAELHKTFSRPPTEKASAEIIRKDLESGGRYGQSALVSYLLRADMTARERRQWLHAAMALVHGTALPFAGEHLQGFAEHVNELPRTLRRLVIGSRGWISLTDITSHSRTEIRPRALLDVLHGLYREISNAGGSDPVPPKTWRDPNGWRDPRWLGFLVANKGFFDQFEGRAFARADHELAQSFGVPAEQLVGGSLSQLGRLMPYHDLRVFQLNREFARGLAQVVERGLARKRADSRLDLGSHLARQVGRLLRRSEKRYPSHPLFFQ
jgi:hypothetical protein